MFELASIHDTAQRCADEKIPLAECAIRRLVREGTIPATIIGNKAMVYWPNLLRFIENGNNVTPEEPPHQSGGIRRIEE